MNTVPNQPRNGIFVSYSHKDRKLFDEFSTMMAPVTRRGLVQVWDDTKIEAGASGETKLETR
jgi:internalin A